MWLVAGRARLLMIFQVSTPKDRHRSRARARIFADPPCRWPARGPCPVGGRARHRPGSSGVRAGQQVGAGPGPAREAWPTPRPRGDPDTDRVRDAGDRRRLDRRDLAVGGPCPAGEAGPYRRRYDPLTGRYPVPSERTFRRMLTNLDPD